MCELVNLKGELLSENNQGTEKQQKQFYILNQILKTISEKKKNVLNESFNYIPCETTFSEEIEITQNYDIDFEENKSHNNNCSDNNCSDNNSDNENCTESSYEFSDADNDETEIVNKSLAKALNKLDRNRQTKSYIHITRQ